MDLSTLTVEPRGRKNRKRVGRGPGSGNGKTSGKGHKGQKARSGYSRRFGFEGGQMPLNRRLPKRGFHQEARFPMAPVNLDVLEKHFNDGDEVTAEALVARGLAKESRGGIKVLARGELTKKLAIKAGGASQSARQKIEAAGGTVEIVTAPKRQPKGEAE